MDIVSVIPDSFQEYENRHSLVLFCSKCNLRCEYCYNLNEIFSGKIIGSAIDVINKWLNPMHQAVVFLGGEPTVWEDSLIDSVNYVKNKGLETKLYTNGINVVLIKKLLRNNLIDSFSVDFKCIDNFYDICGIHFEDDDYLRLLDITINAILDSGKQIELRTTESKYILDMDGLKSYVFKKYPSCKHIIQKDFRDMIKK